MKSKLTIEINFEDRPLSSDLIAATKLLAELVASNYAFPFNGEGQQTLYLSDPQKIHWKLSLKEYSE
jgi:hypothetical protein